MKQVRCAIYTRKSSEEGLAQDFNSLDAQREACEAYIKSQMHEGWILVDKQYNDGGYSGGTMERPAFKELLKDIGNDEIDIVVVYKVDRLTRSLMDFSKIIDVFDKHMPDIIGSFMNRFSVDILNYLKLGAEEVFQQEKVPYYELELPGTGKNERFGMDGSVTLRFWKADAQTLSFHKIFKQQHERMPFTYLVVALGDTACMAETLLALKRLLRQKNAPKDAPAITVPIIVRTKSETDIVKVYTEHEDDLLFEIVQNKDIYSYKALVNEEIVERAKIFNYRYGRLYDVISPIIKPYKGGKKPFDDQLKALLEQAWAEERQRENENKLQSDKAEVEAQWKRMDIFSRESSIAQALHQDVKRWLIEDKHYSPEKDKAELQKIEHRRWVLFMITQGFRYDKNRDNDVKDHDCILSWEDLEKNRPDTMECDFTPYFILQNSTDSK